MSVHAKESRDFRSYHAFLRAARNYMEGPLVAQMHDAYDAALERTPGEARPAPGDWRGVEALLDSTTEFQFYCWSYRNLQRFKSRKPNWHWPKPPCSA